MAAVALVDNLPRLPNIATAQMATGQRTLTDYRTEAAKPFSAQAELDELIPFLRQLEKELADSATHSVTVNGRLRNDVAPADRGLFVDERYSSAI